MMTYGEIYKEFAEKCNCIDLEKIVDFRPAFGVLGVTNNPYAIVIWFDDGSKIVYESENAKKYDKQFKDSNIDEIIKRLQVLADECRKAGFDAESKGYNNIADKYYAKQSAYLSAIEVIKNNYKVGE